MCQFVKLRVFCSPGQTLRRLSNHTKPFQEEKSPNQTNPSLAEATEEQHPLLTLYWTSLSTGVRP